MTHRILSGLLLCCLSATLSGFAQETVQQQDICTHLQQTGRVILHQPESLTLLITDPEAAAQAALANGKILSQGFRIRVFSGNQQGASKNKAYKIKTDLQEYMPELDAYVVFKSPNWRLTVGNFRTGEEAHAMLRILKKEFPAYGREMFVVKEDIEL